MSPRLIGYYQSFDRNLNFAQRGVGLTHVHLASIHFGVEPDGEPYIHLNNLAPIHGALTLCGSKWPTSKRVAVRSC